jgi:DNA repair protein RadD
VQLRDYQQASVSEVLAAVDAQEHPCLMLPTAAGKSAVLAALCHRFVQERGQRVLMLTHVKELIEQNSKRLHDYWRALTGGQFAPVGIYSAGLRQKRLGHQITYAGVQSIASRIEEIADTVDVIIVDESHLIPTKGEGRYRKVFAACPNAARIGLTASPWRLGHGSLCEGEGALFTRLLNPPGTSVREMVDAGWLAPLRSKHTEVQLLDLVGEVTKRGGEYVESELAAAVNLSEPNEKTAAEIVARMNAGDRRHCLVFCVSIAHAGEMARILTALGAPTGVVHGEMSSLERTDVLTRFRVGELRCVANVNVLTTGYDFPDLDMMAFCRPTLSPVLYVQMGGRGMRLKVDGTTPHKDCLVLDFAGLVRKHGPITDVRPPRAKGAAKGEMPIKTCPVCSELVTISCMECPSCAHVFEAPPKAVKLHTDDIMGERKKDGEATVTGWCWFNHQTREGKKMLAVEYVFKEPVEPVPEHEDTPRILLKAKRTVTEYWPVFSEEWARSKMKKLAEKCGVELTTDPRELMARLNAAPHPETVKLSLKAGWVRVGRAKWAAQKQEETAA